MAGNGRRQDARQTEGIIRHGCIQAISDCAAFQWLGRAIQIIGLSDYLFTVVVVGDFTLGNLMTVELAVFRKAEPRSPETFAEVEELAQRFLVFLNNAEVQEGIATVHQHGASSAAVQRTILPGAQQLGFTPEKKGLFQAYAVPALRPDYYVPVRDTGVLLEVERGKTTANNMDLLDLWKCHICEHAEYLFLLVPQVRQTKKGRNTRPFKQVQSRLETFFKPNNYINVEAVFLFGY